MSNSDETEADTLPSEGRLQRRTKGTAEHVTPLGEHLRQLRLERGVALKDMAEHLGVSPAYLSALEKGQRGKPTWVMIQGMLAFFHIIWDEADELVRLAQMSDPRVRIDTIETSAQTTFFANRLAREIRDLNEQDIEAMTAILDAAQMRKRPKKW
ncbi:helix-turn-helix domain-containing protein [Microvirga sp. W0021]|uniref:Helix-turn-helix domain-containing protein n=1 Tax=Hohaiivirga grylli TaxID=3133970 RepID=A0ABV0BGH8_9HYPH